MYTNFHQNPSQNFFLGTNLLSTKGQGGDQDAGKPLDNLPQAIYLEFPGAVRSVLIITSLSHSHSQGTAIKYSQRQKIHIYV